MGSGVHSQHMLLVLVLSAVEIILAMEIPRADSPSSIRLCIQYRRLKSFFSQGEPFSWLLLYVGGAKGAV